MPKGKIIKKGVKGAIKRAGGKAKLGAGAVAAERATDVLDNPYISAAEGAEKNQHFRSTSRKAN